MTPLTLQCAAITPPNSPLLVGLNFSKPLTRLVRPLHIYICRPSGFEKMKPTIYRLPLIRGLQKINGVGSSKYHGPRAKRRPLPQCYIQLNFAKKQQQFPMTLPFLVERPCCDDVTLHRVTVPVVEIGLPVRNWTSLAHRLS